MSSYPVEIITANRFCVNSSRLSDTWKAELIFPVRYIINDNGGTSKCVNVN